MRGTTSTGRAGLRAGVIVLSSLLATGAAADDKTAPASKKAPPTATKATAGAASSAPKAAPAGTGAAGTEAGTPPAPAPATDLATVKPEDMPTAVRMRRLEQKTQALKERAWELKARVQMLKEQMLGGGVGAQAVVEHANEMGASFRLIKLIYALDGTQVFARTDETAEDLYKTKAFDVFAGPISPGSHNLTALATYRGHGYGVFEYLAKYTFTARGNQAFIAGEGKISKIDCRGFEKGGPTTPLEKRSSIECTVVQVQPEKPVPAEAGPGSAAPSPTPAGAPPAATGTAPASATPAASGTNQPGK